MSPSSTKDRLLAIGIHRAPPGMSKEEFLGKMKALAAAVVALPVVQKNVLKYRIISANSSFDEHMKEFGMPASTPQHIALLVAESETPEQMLEISKDPELHSLVTAAEEMTPERGASIFSAHVVEKLNKPGRDHKDNLRVVGLFKVPQHLTPAQHAEKFEALVDSIVAHPTIQKNMLGYTMWLPNDTMNTSIQTMRIPAPERTCVLILEAENWERAVEIAKDADVAELVAGGHQDFGFLAESSSFSADFITMFDKE
ncbi:hypothetical protein C8F04DRAFT_1096063 [Mycena alexandri]|uniref:EthD domain-containing protein n=1 Tax=Mycena alexandri TaxID=1745969 RepID=A0AAD6SYT1_9AGAR|nr:hypothetical protein C8F04DRAFT_1096063 [Mycena alexandri]